MGLNYHFHNVLCINVLHHLYRKMCEVSNLSGRQKSTQRNVEQQKKALSIPAGGGCFGEGGLGQHRWVLDTGTAALGLPSLLQLAQLPPGCRGPPALDSPVTPVPALAAIAPAVSHPAPRGKSSDYPNTVIKGEMCF